MNMFFNDSLNFIHHCVEGVKSFLQKLSEAVLLINTNQSTVPPKIWESVS